jgi:hypothetical protein
MNEWMYVYRGVPAAGRCKGSDFVIGMYVCINVCMYECMYIEGYLQLADVRSRFRHRYVCMYGCMYV